MIFDLHSHTLASDGKFTSEELVLRAVEHRVSVLAITDHDSVAGLPSAREAIKKHNLPLHLIAGIEISTVWENKDIHVVGLNVDENNPILQSFIVEQAERRDQRAILMGERLARANIEGAYEGAKKLAGDGSLTRSHFAQWLVEHGYANTMQNVFKKYLGRGKIGYVPPQWCSISEAIEIIHQVGGQAVLAHPHRYKLTPKWTKRLLNDFSQAGGDGMEVALPQQTQDNRRLLVQYSNDYNLLASQGSDFHYPSAWSDLGRNLWLPAGATAIWDDWNLPKVIEPQQSNIEN
ncbi:PHP domain-containing protein [Vibrio sp. SS-MA-C1-2]|uniref:RNase RNM n=1 Tax=Vibrio sp. SS-MA-C1-2 TaxID=2908646 RepID=UPI001F283960|nr:PHP domain-containing protein [Vibrio sp. SS-MA-C1-2]UJF19825.1 PHP domain-containing protein [Vibrio sp. SS-MA-C1-2]